jgi:hypothetical protein
MEAEGTRMKRLNYGLPPYPTLNFNSYIEVVDRPRAVFKVFVQARGRSALRKRWLQAFETWCTEHGYVPVGRRAYKQTIERSATVIGYPSIADFIIEWVGLDWVDQALQDMESRHQSIGADLRSLRNDVLGISKALVKIEERTSIADFRLWAAARGLLGLELPSFDMTGHNWDHVLKPESESQA